jgi:Copper type II ascorbate-dependent monooxygenase, N-terminal domain
MKSVWWLTALLSIAACSDGAPTAVEPRDDEVDEENEPSDAPATRKDAGKDASVKDAAPVKDASKPDASAPLAQAKSIPCSVQSALAKCQSCHAAEPVYGATMPLVTAADFQKTNKKGRPYHEGVAARVGGSEKPAMPPPGYELSADEKSALLEWVGAEAPPSDEKCADTPAPVGPVDTGGETVEQCDVELEFRAGGNGQPFKVPTTPDYYHCFYFKPDFAETTVGKGFIPMIDNKAVIHHWLLFVRDDASKRPGTSERCTGVNPGATLIAGWAPGGENTIAPKDVGIQLPRGPNIVYQLELHYNNTVGPQATDQSGVKLCATNQPQKEMAAIHYLGTENIVAPPGMTTVGSTCRPTKPVTLLSINPHMHKSGHHAKMVINRKDGKKEVYHDAPFSFESQITYNKTAQVAVGDTITAECTFKNDSTRVKTFAEGTEDEMCYLFTLAYPIGAMNTGSDLLGVGLPGPNRCMK